MYQPPHVDSDNRSSIISIRNSPGWHSVRLPSPRPSIPTLNEPDDEQHRDDSTISSLEKFSYQESSDRSSVLTVHTSPFDNRSGKTTLNSLGQAGSHLRNTDTQSLREDHPAWPSQLHGATSLHSQLPLTTDAQQAGPSMEFLSSASDPGTNTMTGAVTVERVSHLDCMARTNAWVRSHDIHDHDHLSAWSPARVIDYAMLSHSTDRALSVVVKDPLEPEDAPNDNKEVKDERLSILSHETSKEWLPELLDADRYEETSKNGEFQKSVIPLLLVFIVLSALRYWQRGTEPCQSRDRAYYVGAVKDVPPAEWRC